MSDEESKNDEEFKKKANSLIGYFFGIIHDCRKELYDREYTLRENERYKITVKLSKEISIDLEFEDKNTGKIQIQGKMKVSQKGLDYSGLLSITIFGGISEPKTAEKTLKTEMEIIQDGSITFKIMPNVIIVQILVEDKGENDFLKTKHTREIIFTVIFKNQNDGDDNNYYVAQAQEKRRLAYGQPGFIPGPKPGFQPSPAFRPFYY